MTILFQRFRAVACFVLRSHKVEVLPVLPLVYWNQKMVRSELDYSRGLGRRWNGIWIFSWIRNTRGYGYEGQSAMPSAAWNEALNKSGL